MSFEGITALVTGGSQASDERSRSGLRAMVSFAYLFDQFDSVINAESNR